MTGWVPMGAESSFRETLYDGVPPWMFEPLANWARYRITNLADYARAFDLATRAQEPTVLAAMDGWYALYQKLHASNQTIRFLDYLVFAFLLDEEDSLFDPDAAEALEVLLASGGSAWRVGMRDGHPGLEHRVPSGVQEAVDDVIADAEAAGELLSEAWHAVFGRESDPEEAYEKAIKAVETVAIPIVEPNNRAATLGTALRVMRDQGGWGLELTNREGAHYSNLIVGMCEALWHGHPSRHGGNGYRRPTQAEAEAAVMLAVPLVQWFHSGAVAHR